MKKYHIIMMIATVVVMLFANVYASEELIYSEGLTGFPQTRFDDSVSLMGDDEETMEDVIVKAWDNMEESIDVSRFNMTLAEYQSQQSRYLAALENNPFYTYFTNGASRAMVNGQGYIISIYPVYTIADKEEAFKIKAELEKATEEILFLIDDTMSDFDKIMTVHDYMVLNYYYDTTYSNFSISILTTKTGVCQSYAYAFKHLMNKLNIDCTYVPSNSMQHIWNLVKVDGSWYHIDVTWDDPVTDIFGQVRHSYALKSTDAFKYTTYPDTPHTDFNTGTLKANSKKYDDEDWHSGIGSIVHCNGVTYWWDGDDLVDSNGKEIVDDIIGNRKWKIDNKYTFPNDDDIFAGLATHNGKLYYNSDSAIYSYDPATKITETIKSQIGLSGLFIEKNTLYYTVSENSPNNTVVFKKGGKIELEPVISGGSYRTDADTVVTRVNNTSEDPVTVFLFDGKKAKTEVCGNGMSKVEMETDAPTYVFVWDSKLKPLAKKSIIK